MAFYHAGMRALQDRFEGRAVPDRLAAHRMRTRFTDQDRAFIEAAPFFFLATATDANADCSFKGGEPGFVRVVGDNQLAWPDYDGNRMYRSLGNIVQNPRVGLLFIRLDGTLIDGAARPRVNGRAELDESPQAVAGLPGAKRLVRVTAEHIFFNCPRSIPTLAHRKDPVHTPAKATSHRTRPGSHDPFVKDIFAAERARKKGD